MTERHVNPEIAERYNAAVNPLIKGAQDNHRRDLEAQTDDD
jgi:hypothetical protein